MLVPPLVGLAVGIVVYAIIKASHNNSKVIKTLTIIGICFAIILAVILLFFLISAMV
ncbi:MAG: hypothetical protein ACYDEX_09535 [Mobilitalea sp.]